MRNVKGCTKAAKIRNETMRSDLNIFSIKVKIEEEKTEWKDHVARMVDKRLTSKIINYYQQFSKKYLNRPHKRLFDDRDMKR
jgi:hypothetical protein